MSLHFAERCNLSVTFAGDCTHTGINLWTVDLATKDTPKQWSIDTCKKIVTSPLYIGNEARASTLYAHPLLQLLQQYDTGTIN